jgi:hypothetical protein
MRIFFSTQALAIGVWMSNGEVPPGFSFKALERFWSHENKDRRGQWVGSRSSGWRKIDVSHDQRRVEYRNLRVPRQRARLNLSLGQRRSLHTSRISSETNCTLNAASELRLASTPPARQIYNR